MRLPTPARLSAPLQRRLLLGLAAALSVLLAVSLGTEGIALRQYDGVRVLTPGHLEQARMPVTIGWQVTDERLARLVEDGAAYFGVFVDRPPIAPGDNLSSLLTADCLGDPDCPTRDWFTERHIHITSGSVVELSVIPRRSGAGADELHQATIVVLDAQGTRLGESAWTARFFLARHGEGNGP